VKRVNVLEEDDTAVAPALTEQQEENDNIRTEVMLLQNYIELMKQDVMRNKQ